MPDFLVDYKDLPATEGSLPGTSWALFNSKGGGTDQLGTLNYLTPEVVAQAAAGIKTGERVSLDLPLDTPTYALFGRQDYKHEIIEYSEEVCDDVINMNTQCSSQWDGFRHVCHAGTFQFYQGLLKADVLSGKAGNQNGIQNWLEAGGIAGRGVLLDWVAWIESQGKPVPDPLTKVVIPAKDLQAVAQHQKVTFQPGDILLVRTGWVKNYISLDQQTRKKITERTGPHQSIGVESSMETVEWIWNNHFAGCAGDQPAWEALPVNRDGPDVVYLHDHMLTRLGCPIGEMWNFEPLAAQCKKHNRWTFFVTSAPLHIPGGIGSPPNALAIF